MTDPTADDAGEVTPAGGSSEILKQLQAKGGGGARYRLVGEVARGGMGVIFRVRDEELRRDLAMKVALSRRRGPNPVGTTEIDPKTLGRFLEEAQITGQLDHPGIVPVHEMGIDSEGRIFFTMQLVKGQNLKEILSYVRDGREGWTKTRALGVMLRVCEAMAYAHSKNVIHRDLKPANVMVGRFGEVYVMDWGLARILGQADVHDIRLDTDFAGMTLVDTAPRAQVVGSQTSGDALFTMDGDVVGTPAYMAPEQAQGMVEELDARADVYSVGAMLYHLLAGHEPFVPPGRLVSQHAILESLLEGPPRPLHEEHRKIPAELVAICEKAMARDPKRRYADMQELAEDLRAFLEGRVVRAYETGAVAELRKWLRRNKGLAAALVASVVIAIGGLGAVGWAQARGRDAAEAQQRIAQENERVALANAERARKERANVLRLSALQKIEDLQAQATELWPARPRLAPRYEEWIAEAETLVAGLETDEERGLVGHYGQLEELRERALEDTTEPAEDVELTWTFADDEDRWWHAQLEKLVGQIEDLADPEVGLLRGTSERWGWGVVRRLEFARGVADLTVSGPAARSAWKVAAESIRDPDECPRYEGLELAPQLGLLPVGRDPITGLWEFVDLQTGEAPARNARGELVLDESTGLVFVLIPGGTFPMGSQATDTEDYNYDAASTPDEQPVHGVTLAPFFLSKFEMTQGQWLHFTGRNPSRYDPSEGQISLLHPVEQVSWEECVDVLADLGLSLPTEAQWEYACRAETTTPWFTGHERGSLRGAVNLADRTAADAGADWSAIQDWPELEDGFVVHAPVGTFAPNEFGLHEVHGNVREWCLEGVGAYSSRVQERDGLRITTSPRNRIFRGGGFASSATLARSAYRGTHTPQVRFNDLGVRPMRGIDPE